MRAFIVAILFLMISATSIFAALPGMIQYQGKLTDLSGVGENAELDMRFRIFDVETGGDSLWAMTIADVPIVHGLFDVNIGPIDLPFDEQYWLEIVVDGNVLAPRVLLTTSPYAFRAAVADSFTGGVSPWTQDTMVAHWDSIRGIPAGFADGIDNEGLPGGSDGQVQFNNAGAFGGSADFIFDNSTGYVGIGSPGAWYPFTVYKSADMIFAASIENSSPSGWGLEIRTMDTTSTRSSLEIYNNFVQSLWVRNNGNVGIGVDPTCKLDVAGKIRTIDLQMTTGATNGYLLQSDATGNASWVSPATIATVNDSDWHQDGNFLYPFNTTDSVVIGGTTAYDKLDVNGSMTIRGDGGSLPHGSGLTSNEEFIRFPGSESDYIISIQDGSGRIQHYWNSTTASPSNLYLEDNERAWMWDISIATHPYMEFKYAPAGLAGDPITWTTHMAFDSLGNVDVLGDVTANAFIGDGSGLTGISDGNWIVSGDDMYSAVSGNVGVGLDDPDVKFQVCGDFEVLSEDYYMYITDGSSVGGYSEPRLPCDVTDGSDCPDTVITTTDLGPVAYDKFFFGLGWAYYVYNRTSFIRPSILNANTADRLIDIDADVDITGDIDVTGYAKIIGKVGIGTANPVDLLHVEAFDDTVGDDDSVFISVRNSCNSDSAFAGIRFKSHSTDSNSFYKSAIAFQRTKTYGRGDLHFIMNDQGNNSNVDISATKMTLTSAGQLGIGTRTPQNALDVAGTTRTEFFVLTDGAANGYILKSNASGNASWVAPSTITTAPDADWTISGSNMYSGVSGNVGIGLTNPTKKLTISGGPGDLFGVDNNTCFVAKNSTGTYERYLWPRAGDNSMYILYGDGLYFRDDDASSNTTMFLSANNRTGLGTTSPAAKLDIDFNSSSAVPHLLLNEQGADYARLYFQNTDTTAFWAIAALPADNPANAKMNFFYIGDRMTIQGDGKVGVGTTNPQGALDVNSTTGAFIVPRMTTAQRDALTPVNGMIIYNTSTNQFNFRENGAWVTK